MEVKDKTMYHFHHNNLYKDIWVPGNEITVDDKFEALFCVILKKYNTGMRIGDRVISFDKVIKHYLEEEQDKETYIKLLKDSEYVIRGAKIFDRELALEIVRRLCYSDLPSRQHSIWLCDEKSKRHWEDTLGNNNSNLELFKLSVTGNMFKSSDAFLPDDCAPFGEMIDKARDYWNPKFQEDFHEAQAEYLFQGKVKILERINKTN